MLHIFVNGDMTSRTARRQSAGNIDFRKLGSAIAEELGHESWKLHYFHTRVSDDDSGTRRFLHAIGQNEQIKTVEVNCSNWKSSTMDLTMINYILTMAREQKANKDYVLRHCALVSKSPNMTPVMKVLEDLQDTNGDGSLLQPGTVATVFWEDDDEYRYGELKRAGNRSIDIGRLCDILVERRSRRVA